MKLHLPIAATFVLALALAGCEEEPPYINFKPSGSTFDSTYIETPAAAEPKEVLLEDITGVRCPNCPKAAEIAKELKETYPGKLNVIAMQPLTFSNLLTKPFSTADGEKFDTRHDYRTRACDAIWNLVAKPSSLPAGYIDRTIFSPATDPLLDKEKWADKTGLQVTKTSPVNIALAGKYNAAANTITVDVTIRYTAAIPVGKSHNLSIALTQDSIIDVQEDGHVYDSAYVNMHLMRDMLTAYTGDALNASLVAGRVFQKRYVYKVPEVSFTFGPMVIKHLHAIAYIHETGTGQQVVQSKEAKIIE